MIGLHTCMMCVVCADCKKQGNWTKDKTSVTESKSETQTEVQESFAQKKE